MTRTTLPLAPLAALLFPLLSGSPARAEIDGFELSSVKGLNVELSSRFGTTSGADEHVVNIADCEAYQVEDARARFTVKIDLADGNKRRIAAAWAPPGKTCKTDDVTFSDLSEGCKVALPEEDYADGEAATFEVPLAGLTGGDCDADVEEDAHVYVVLEDTVVATETTTSEDIRITIDLLAPDPPTELEGDAGDRRITVQWVEKETDADEVTYKVYYDDAPIDDPPGEEVRVKEDVDGDSAEIADDDLENGVTYYVRVAAVDDAENEGSLSEEITVTPVETLDFWEHYQGEGGTDDGGFCFVATAAYGTSMAAELGPLRAFRDRVLLPTAAGRSFVEVYYRWGRYAAAFLAERPALRFAARVLLVPVVAAARLATALPPWGVLAVLAGLALGLAAVTGAARERLLRDVPREARR